jgi:uncharacterized membrane protein
MTLLILGLIVFLGSHSIRIVAEPWRLRTIAAIGAHRWKGALSLVSLAGFVMLVMGYGEVRGTTDMLWMPPTGMRHLAALLVLVAFIFLAASGIPGNAIKARLGHPMILGVKVWALAHLLANGSTLQVGVFGCFLVWAVFSFRAARQRDRAAAAAGSAQAVPVPVSARATALTVVAGLAGWALFAFWLHGLLIGVRPLG